MEIDQKTSDTTKNSGAFLNDEVYYKDIVEGQTELICRFDSDNNLTFVNDAYCNYFHLKRKDIIGRRFMDVINEEDREIFQALLSSLDRKNPVATAENRVSLPNRDLRWQQWAIRALFDDKGIIVEYQSVGRDVTERMLTEKFLRESQKNYEELARNANDAMAVILGKDGRHVFVNKRMEEISGYTKADLLKISFREVIHPDELGKINQRYKKSLAGKKIANRFETKLVDKQGQVVPVEISDSITDWQGQTAVLAIIRDISERKKGEKEQKKIRDELEHLVDERTSELVATAEEMELKHNELLLSRSELEKINQELLDTNKALTALARNIDREKEDAEKKVAKIVRSRMLPLLEDFQKNVSFKKYLAEIDALVLSLYKLTPGLKKSAGIILALAPTELRIATMIKNGLTSPAIANVLHISLDTVKSHRRNIRRKLKLNNTKINLASYLDAKM